MVNTFNIERKPKMINKNKATWVPIGESKKQTYTFKELNVENESNENSDFVHMLSSTIYDIVKINAPMLIKESAKNEIDMDFFATESWRDFRRHAEMMTNFLSIDKNTIDKALDEFEEKLIILAGGGGKGALARGQDMVEQGFDMVRNVENVLKESGIAAYGDNGGVIPEIKIRHFLDLLNPSYKTKVGSKTVEKQTSEYDIKTFIDMILSRKDRNFSDYIGKNMKLGTIIDRVFHDFGDGAREVFRKIVSAGNYQKNGSAVGKAELALAMFFSDCKLPRKKGDIQIEAGGKGKFIEVKGASAVITSRMTKSERFPKNGNTMEWSSCSPSLKSVPASVIKALKPQINAATPPTGEGLFNCLATIDNEFKKLNKGDNWGVKAADALKFAFLFGALFRTYSSLTLTKKNDLKSGFNEMWIFNTNDDLGDSKSNLLDATVIKVVPNQNASWYDDGIRILNLLLQKKVDVTYANAHGETQYGFKAIFK